MGRRPLRGSRGFTFVELLLVVVIVAGAVLLVAPDFTVSVRGVRVSEAARALVALSRAARNRAVTTGRAFALELDREEGQVRVVAARDPLAVPDAEDPEVDGTVDERLSERFDLGDRVQIARIELGEEGVIEESPVRVWFSPDGTADEVWVELAAADDEEMRASFYVDPLLGRGRVESDDAE